MKGFYALLAAVAVAGGGAIWYGSRPKSASSLPATVGAGPPSSQPSGAPAAVADGFRGFTLGPETAPVEVTEFSDFECPFCATFATVQMPVIREQLLATGKARWRYRDFPLPNHRWSRMASLAAQCAGEQGKFWELHDQLFLRHQWAQTSKNPRSRFREFAKDVGLDLDRFDACMDGRRYAGRIQASWEEGEALGVAATPTFFVNGRRFEGRPTSDGFKALVDSLTKATPTRK
jgi:protein-disulfide isomerase